MQRSIASVLVRSVLVSAVLAACCASAHAQWQWIGSDGRKVFSDQAPPADVPEKSVVKRPGGAKPTAQANPATPPIPTPASAQTTGAIAKPAATIVRLSGKDAEIEKKKKEAEAAEANKKKEADEKLAANKAENCTRAKRSLATYNSGVRIQTQNDKGEREFMSDEKRAADSKRAQEVVDADCK